MEFSKTELKMFLIALSGGSLYFFLEYSALRLTGATNVSLICTTVPIFSALGFIILGVMKLTKWFVFGSLIALAGVACVVFNGVFVLRLSPLGDFIAFLSVISWSIYSVLLAIMPKEVTELQTTRRLFFYGTITIFPLLFFDDNASSLTEIWGKLEWTHIVGALYLGLIASGASLWLWNLSFNKVGAANTNNFLYLLPIISAVAAAIFFTHEITGWVVAGTLLIFFGLIIANNKQNK
jgi:drug/metabolite transporter (DMT)-like permease